MSLRHALLALFTGRPMTGYDLYKQFLGSAGYVWHASDSQIYPELRRMEEEDLIAGTDLESDSRGTKTRYEITAKGQEVFKEWMNTSLPYPRIKDSHHLKAAYFEWADPDAVRRQLRQHIEHYEALIESWEKLIDSLTAKEGSPLAGRFALLPESEHPPILAYKRFAYEGMILRAQAEIEWARSGLKLVDELNT